MKKKKKKTLEEFLLEFFYKIHVSSHLYLPGVAQCEQVPKATLVPEHRGAGSGLM